MNEQRFAVSTKTRLDQEIFKLKHEIDSSEKHPEPIYTEKPVDPELQTGESRKLGGEMRLRSNWED